MIVRLEKTGLYLRELEDRKHSAVATEDYDTAKQLKAEIDRIRTTIDRPEALEPPPPAVPPARASPVERERGGMNGGNDEGKGRANNWAPPAGPAGGNSGYFGGGGGAGG